jgi:hypothetical protein
MPTPYVSPYVRGRRPTAPIRQVVKKYMPSADDFPTMGGSTSRSTSRAEPMSELPATLWGSAKSFTEVVKNTEITFDYEILEKIAGESQVTYFNRLSKIFTRTTVLHKYNVYVISSNVKSYRVAARSEIIARLLCQMADNKYSSVLDSSFAPFKRDTLEQMYSDDEVWEEVMSYVGGNITRKDEAILLYYKKTQNVKCSSEIFWFNTKKTICKQTEEKCMSKEKILY